MNWDEKRYRVVETGGYLVGSVIDQWEKLGYRPILMSQVLKQDKTVTTLVFEKERLIEFSGIEETVNTGHIDILTGVPCPPIES